MPLSSESRFGVRALTEAVNRLPVSPTQIRDLAIFQPRYLTTTHVDVEAQNGELKLIRTTPRGTEGGGIADKTRSIYTFTIPHLSVNDVVRADDVQNVRAFGGTQAETVAQKVEEKLADGKLSLEMTREHMQLGALLGKVLDADGTEIVDIYKAFGLSPTLQPMQRRVPTSTTVVISGRNGLPLNGFSTSASKVWPSAV